MLVGRRALVGLAIASALTGCASPPPPPPPPPKPVVVGPPTDTVKIPLTDLLARTYYGTAGGIYPGGINQPPPDHDSVARARRNLIKPLDVNGDESPFGKYVLLSIGMSNATQEWCSQNSGPPCTPWSFMGKVAIDPTINHYTLVVVNGAADGQDAPSWTSPSSQAYDRIKFGRLAPLGLSENQVQVVWVKLDDQKPSLSLPADSADANILLTNLGLVMRPSNTLSVSAPRVSFEPHLWRVCDDRPESRAVCVREWLLGEVADRIANQRDARTATQSAGGNSELHEQGSAADIVGAVHLGEWNYAAIRWADVGPGRLRGGRHASFADW